MAITLDDLNFVQEGATLASNARISNFLSEARASAPTPQSGQITLADLEWAPETNIKNNPREGACEILGMVQTEGPQVPQGSATHQVPTGTVRNVRPIGSEHQGSMTGHTLLVGATIAQQQIALTIAKPHFDNTHQGWKAWEYDWSEYLRKVEAGGL